MGRTARNVLSKLLNICEQKGHLEYDQDCLVGSVVNEFSDVDFEYMKSYSGNTNRGGGGRKDEWWGEEVLGQAPSTMLAPK